MSRRVIKRDDIGMYIRFNNETYRPKRTSYFNHGYDHVEEWTLPFCDNDSKFEVGESLNARGIGAPGIAIRKDRWSQSEIWCLS